jgi:hypothetical protein
VTSPSDTREPESISELIADCAGIPSSLQAENLPLPHEIAPPWTVDERCLAQVADLDGYV